MGFLPAGISAKLGNRYEGLWVVRQFLYLVAERIRSVQIEAIGDDEVGVDLWVQDLSGLRVAHQCKAFNELASNWSINDLKKRKVLDKATVQLRRNPMVEFKFVSTIAAVELEDLTRNARLCQTDTEAFYRCHIDGNRERERAFTHFCNALDMNATSDLDRNQAFDLLRRIECHQFADDDSTRQELEFSASMLLEGGTPEAIVAALADIAATNVLRVFHAPELMRCLGQYGFRPKSSHSDPQVSVVLGKLREDFAESIKPLLAAGMLITRSETESLRNMLHADDRPDAILLSGAPGHGKSGILYQLAQELQSTHVVCAIRLDRQNPNALSAAEFGRRLGLPKSPVGCLCDVAAGEPALLILDQLDALRWTSAHASKGLSVCKELLREARAARSMGAKIDVILACRTFDLERDPEIQAWLNNDRYHLRLKLIETKPLPHELIRDIIQKHGGIDPSTLSSTQLKLLESVHHLAMWLEVIISEKELPHFTSPTQLMRLFWQNRRRRIEEAGCSAELRDSSIAALVSYMEEHACLTAPARLLGKDEKLATELQSCGVIRILDQKVTFGHQSNLDFLIADAAVQRMTEERLNIVEWLGTNDRQSLFRREQLRQVLFLLADEDHGRFTACVAALLGSADKAKAPWYVQIVTFVARGWNWCATHLRLPLVPSSLRVRFHLKQLIFEVLGQISPEKSTINLVLALFDDERWQSQISVHVFSANAVYIEELRNRGLLREWLTASHFATWQRAAFWLSCIRGRRPQLVAEVSREVIAQTADWPQRVHSMIGAFRNDVEPEPLFALRLKCIKAGQQNHFTPWKELVEVTPVRALKLYHAMAVGWLSQIDDREQKNHQDGVYDPETMVLSDVAERHPIVTWRQLLPVLIRLLTLRRTISVNHDRIQRMEYRRRFAIPKTLRMALLKAGRRLGHINPSLICAFAYSKEVRRSRVLSELAVRCMARLPASHADASVVWLIADRRRLYCGNGLVSPRWSPAMALVRRQSKQCAQPAFESLQNALLRFRDPAEKLLAKYWLENTRSGYFSNQFGAAQYHLLPCLFEPRISSETRSRIGVLQRKYDGADETAFLTRSRPRGGFVRSSIDGDQRFLRMSDKAWLRLLSSKPVLIDRHRRNWSSSFIESSVLLMSRSFGRAVQFAPDRFAILGLRLKPDTNSHYLVALLNALSRSNPPEEMPADERDKWAPACAAHLDELIQVLSNTRDPSVAQAICQLLWSRDDLAITEKVVSFLLRFAVHTDPVSNPAVFDPKVPETERTTEMLETDAINCVRGIVARTMASVLWRERDLLSRFATYAYSLLTDPVPAVRVAAIHICSAVWNLDQRMAFDWFVAAIRTDNRIAACHESQEIYNRCFPQHYRELAPVIRGMLVDPRPAVAFAGAIQVAARHLFCNQFRREVRQCYKGGSPQRRGVAHVISQLVTDEKYTARCLNLLRRLRSDDDKDVRRELMRIIYAKGFFEAPWAAEFLSWQILHSKWNDGHSLLWRLKEHPNSLEIFSNVLFEYCDLATKAGASKSKADSTFQPDLETLSHLLLRLYGEATLPKGDSIRRRCLDAWDGLLEQFPYLSSVLSRNLDALRK